MYRRIFVLAICATPLVLSGCGAADPISPSRTFTDTTIKQVENAILAGASQRGWQSTVVKPGEIHCVYQKGKWIAAVNIDYDKEGFRITLGESTNMLAPRSPGKVDRKYNQWVNNLATTITKVLYSYKTMK